MDRGSVGAGCLNACRRVAEVSETLSRRLWRQACALAASQGKGRKGGRAPSAKDAYERNLKSYYKTDLFHRFGGHMWCRILITLGHVHPRMVFLVQQVIDERIRTQGKREPTEAAVPGPRSAKRSLAAAQGQEVPGPVGVQHKVSRAKRMRERASLISKHLQANDRAWWEAYRRCERDWCAHYERQHQRLEREATQAWDEAEAVSYETGIPFKLRTGEWSAALTDDSIVAEAVRRWLDDMEHGRVTNPSWTWLGE